VIKILSYFLIFFFITNCSFDKTTSFWTKKKKIESIKNSTTKKIFISDNFKKSEYNSDLKINLISRPIDKSFINDFDNNNGRINYNGNLKNISKFKFKKIKLFNEFDPELIFSNNNVIFFDNNGTIFKFDSSSKLLWKKNYYDKSEKKMNPILFLSNKKNTLIVSDNIAKYYALNINTGELLWTKKNSAPFNSQVKVYKDKFFVVDFNNVLRCFSVKDGSEIWKVSTENPFIKSQKKLSLLIVEDKVFFINSIGDVSSVDIKTGDLQWQTPTQNTTIFEEGFSLKFSDMIANNKTIFFSSNKNEFYSIDLLSGVINWKQKINSTVKPTLVDDMIFSVSSDGFLIILNSKNGNIIRITDIFNFFKKKKRFKIKPVGFILGSKNIYLTTNRGVLLIIDVLTGKTLSVLKIDNEKISRPAVLNQNLFIVKENAVIKLN